MNEKIWGNFFLAAIDLTLPPRTNRMRYHKTVFASNWKLKIMRKNFFEKFCSTRKKSQFYFSTQNFFFNFFKFPETFAKKICEMFLPVVEINRFKPWITGKLMKQIFYFSVGCKKLFFDISYGSSVMAQTNLSLLKNIFFQKTRKIIFSY